MTKITRGQEMFFKELNDSIKKGEVNELALYRFTKIELNAMAKYIGIGMPSIYKGSVLIGYIYQELCTHLNEFKKVQEIRERNETKRQQEALRREIAHAFYNVKI